MNAFGKTMFNWEKINTSGKTGKIFKIVSVSLILFLGSFFLADCTQSTGEESSVSVESNIMSATATSVTNVFQAENASMSGGTISSSVSGYTGTGYVTMSGTSGAYIEFTVTATSADSAAVIYWYYNNTTGSSVSYNVTNNGTSAGGKKNFSTNTGWSTSSRTISLVSGTNLIRMTASSTTTIGINFDKIQITSTGFGSSTSSTSSSNASSGGISSVSSSKASSVVSSKSSSVSSSKISSTSSSISSSTVSSTSDTLSAPTSLSIIDYTDNYAYLTWKKATNHSGVTGYKIYKSGSLFATTTAINYKATGLSSSTTYSFTVRAYSSSNESTDSNAVSITTSAVPTSVTPETYGAVGNGTTSDKAAIQSAIDACPSGGKVVLASGKTYLSGSLYLKSNMTLEVNGTLLGSDTVADYDKNSLRFPYYASGNNYNGLINAYSSTYSKTSWGLSNIRITGTGTINGSKGTTVGSITGHGLTVLGTAQAAASEDSDRADLITVKGVNGFYIDGSLSIVNPSMHVIFISYSNSVVLTGITSDTYDIHNADGVDLATSSNAWIFGNTFNTGDDCINTNAGTGQPGVSDGYTCQYLYICSNTLKKGHGGVVAGSFTAGWIQDVYCSDNTMTGTEIGYRFKTGSGNGGGAKNWYIEDSTITSTAKNAALFFDGSYETTYTAASGYGVFQNITCKNITIVSPKDYGIFVAGNSGYPMTGLTFDTISISGAGTNAISLKYCTNSAFNNITSTGSKTGCTLNTSGSNTGNTVSGNSPVITVNN
jgi:exo-poly-alpha-galacturonosidase